MMALWLLRILPRTPATIKLLSSSAVIQKQDPDSIWINPKGKQVRMKLKVQEVLPGDGRFEAEPQVTSNRPPPPKENKDCCCFCCSRSKIQPNPNVHKLGGVKKKKNIRFTSSHQFK